MKKIFRREAVANHVLPIDDRGFERVNLASPDGPT
jgi:hypothetical protein